MAYVPGFKHDIFISYARVDDLPAPGEDAGWVTRLHEHLDHMLTQRFGRMGVVSIWRDGQELGGSVPFDEAIERAIKDSAVFLVLNSPGYLAEGGYALKELELFHRKAQAEPFGLKVNNGSRIFNLNLQHIPQEDWPPEMQGTAGFSFYDADGPGMRGWLLPPGSERFHIQLRRLVHELELTLRALKSEAEGQKLREQQTKPARAEQTVFLAHTEGRLRLLGRRVENELRLNGVNVISRIPPPYEARAHEEALVKALGVAALSVHLLDDAPGAEIDGEPESFYSEAQLELGMRHARAQLVWVADSVDAEAVEDERHRELLRRAAGYVPGAGRVYSFLRGRGPELSRAILEELERLAAPAPTTPQGSHIFICYRRGESTIYAGTLYERLTEHFGKGSVFMDLGGIEPGDDFVEVIKGAVTSSAVLLVLINRGWAGHDTTDGRRLQEAGDFVRLEVSTALRQNIRVVPVLINDAAMPREEELPDDLKPLARRNAFQCRAERWLRDVDDLISILKRQLKK